MAALQQVQLGDTVALPASFFLQPSPPLNAPPVRLLPDHQTSLISSLTNCLIGGRAGWRERKHDLSQGGRAQHAELGPTLMLADKSPKEEDTACLHGDLSGGLH